jgi:hypothetical protein
MGQMDRERRLGAAFSKASPHGSVRVKGTQRGFNRHVIMLSGLVRMDPKPHPGPNLQFFKNSRARIWREGC